MKTIKILFAIMIAFISTQSVNAQTSKVGKTAAVKTQTIKVYGECGMCQSRIEKVASKVAGIRSARWDENTLLLTIKYDATNATAVDDVQKKIASVGHDTEKYTATDAAYNKLPGCCHYERKKS